MPVEWASAEPLAGRAQAIAKGWLLMLLERAPLDAVGAIPAADARRRGPRDLRRLRARARLRRGARPPRVPPATSPRSRGGIGALAGAHDAGATSPPSTRCAPASGPPRSRPAARAPTTSPRSRSASPRSPLSPQRPRSQVAAARRLDGARGPGGACRLGRCRPSPIGRRHADADRRSRASHARPARSASTRTTRPPHAAGLAAVGVTACPRARPRRGDGRRRPVDRHARAPRRPLPARGRRARPAARRAGRRRADRRQRRARGARRACPYGRLAQAIRRAIRRQDLVASDHQGRAWVIAPAVGRAGAIALAERIGAGVEHGEHWRGAPLAATIGFAVYGEDGRDAATLIDRAEEAMLAASAAGVRIGEAIPCRRRRRRAPGPAPRALIPSARAAGPRAVPARRRRRAQRERQRADADQAVVAAERRVRRQREVPAAALDERAAVDHRHDDRVARGSKRRPASRTAGCGARRRSSSASARRRRRSFSPSEVGPYHDATPGR